MKKLLPLAVLLLLPLCACGHKGSLKTPSQIAADEAKKEHDRQKTLEKDTQDNAAPADQQP